MNRLFTRSLNSLLKPNTTGKRQFIDTFISPSFYNLISSYFDRYSNYDEFNNVVMPLFDNQSPYHIKHDDLEKNIRFRTWIRKVYLNIKHGQNKNLLVSAERNFMQTDTLPTYNDVVTHFNLKDWKRSDKFIDEDIIKKELVSLRESDPTKKFTLEEHLEMLGCCVYGMNEFNVFCEFKNIYDFLTSNFMNELSAHVYKTCKEVSKSKDNITILEIGCGNGRLSHFLNQSLSGKSHVINGKAVNINVIATDSHMWRLKSNSYPVLKMGYHEALAAFEPDIVICSWMPMNQDWSASIRKYPSVTEYILIGETDYGCCGDSWLTWGCPARKSKDADSDHNSVRPSLDLFDFQSRDFEQESAASFGSRHAHQTPPFSLDGFEKSCLESVSKFQLCRYDRSVNASNSKTFSFSRTRK